MAANEFLGHVPPSCPYNPGRVPKFLRLVGAGFRRRRRAAHHAPPRQDHEVWLVMRGLPARPEV